VRPAGCRRGGRPVTMGVLFVWSGGLRSAGVGIPAAGDVVQEVGEADEEAAGDEHDRLRSPSVAAGDPDPEQVDDQQAPGGVRGPREGLPEPGADFLRRLVVEEDEDPREDHDGGGRQEGDDPEEVVPAAVAEGQAVAADALEDLEGEDEDHEAENGDEDLAPALHRELLQVWPGGGVFGSGGRVVHWPSLSTRSGQDADDNLGTKRYGLSNSYQILINF
jgi:hypothetical protein